MKNICFEEIDSVSPNKGLLLVQNSETGVKVAKITKNPFFLHIFQVLGDKFCIKAPVNDGTQYLITRIRHKPTIGRNNMEKIDVDGGKK